MRYAGTMIRTRDVELAVGRAMAEAYPWLLKVERLPDVGLYDVCGMWHGFEAANDDRA